MQRKIYESLLAWKNQKEFKPLMVLGVRQSGKTYIIEEFCKKEYKNYVHINLFENENVITLFIILVSHLLKSLLDLKFYLVLILNKRILFFLLMKFKNPKN